MRAAGLPSSKRPWRTRRPARETVSSGQLLARRPGADVANQDDPRFGHDLPGTESACRASPAERFGTDPNRTAPRRVHAPGPTRSKPSSGLRPTGQGHRRSAAHDADDGNRLKRGPFFGPRRIERTRGTDRPVAHTRPSLFARFRGPNLARPQKSAAACIAATRPCSWSAAARPGCRPSHCLGAQLQVDTLIVDRDPDRRQLAQALSTPHPDNQVQVNHLPYMPFPPS